MDVQLKDAVLLMIGLIAGWATTHVYYRKSFVKGLSTYLMFHSSPMSGMARDVRGSLEVEFKGRQVSNLIEAQFLIINDGVKALRDLIEPMTLRWSKDVKVLDAEIVRAHPEGIKVDVRFEDASGRPDELQVIYPLLNAREWFILKVVADGPAEATDWTWTVATDELPRKLPLLRFTLDDLKRLPLPFNRRLRAMLLALLAFGSASTVGWFLSLVDPWVKANPSAANWSTAIGIGQLLLVFGTLTGVLLAGGLASKAIQGFTVIGRSLPPLPKEVVDDIWRGHASQADTIQRLQKAQEKP